MIRVSTLEDAIRHLEDGDRVILTIDGKDIGIVFADEVEVLEEMDDRADLAAYRKAKAEPGEAIPVEKILDDREKERAARRVRPRRRQKAAG